MTGDHGALPSSDVPHPRTWALHSLRPTARFLIRRWYDVRVHHPERFPASGPVIAAANHVGFVDGPLLAIFAPRPVHAWTKQEMFKGALGAFLTQAGQIELDRSNADIHAVRSALRVLRDGGAVGVFPEGTRGPGDFSRFRRGAAYLGMVTGAPIVPVTFVGTRLPGGGSGSLPPRGSRFDIVIGNPVTIPAVAWPRRRDAVASASFQLREHLLAELAAALAETGRALPGPLPAADRAAAESPSEGEDLMKEKR